MVRVDADTAEWLEGPITIDDLKWATFSMRSGKCPGPDGFPTFFDKLAPILIEMFNESLIISKIPQTLNQASISTHPSIFTRLSGTGSLVSGILFFRS